ncbi:hypothetical protein HQO84_24810 [Rhodococcus fascians]|uniref:hypothetical protein n=1 Tax=Rhodococcoides fascians TaxID=1828 RepID=UPI0012D3AB97|nr:hypothetical protein [Rhodococcus fascians]MBX5333319.1 hypothetical protein [Rhodococcus fascians]MBY3989326.1 hypothetical protein [Rhodococcus fascians]MBY3999069.1 hypothetical protein [Rhodococcus fascians]MBY4004873.1 hypothetical protein [Rhodococcus fascians]MBY4009585.1 hypothetical protein [Rhodococcus fascians]
MTALLYVNSSIAGIVVITIYGMIDMNTGNASDGVNAVIPSNAANAGNAVNPGNNRSDSISSNAVKSERPQKGTSRS